MTARPRLAGKRRVELVERDQIRLESGPGIIVGVDGVDRADEVARQSAFALEAVERLERAGGQDATEVPQHGAKQLRSLARNEWQPRRHDVAGAMFWLTRNRFFGSYFAFTDARRR